jgi:hypothetical protein
MIATDTDNGRVISPTGGYLDGGRTTKSEMRTSKFQYKRGSLGPQIAAAGVYEVKSKLGVLNGEMILQQNRWESCLISAVAKGRKPLKWLKKDVSG